MCQAKHHWQIIISCWTGVLVIRHHTAAQRRLLSVLSSVGEALQLYAPCSHGPVI